MMIETADIFGTELSWDANRVPVTQGARVCKLIEPHRTGTVFVVRGVLCGVEWDDGMVKSGVICSRLIVEERRDAR